MGINSRALAQLIGGKVKPSERREYGITYIVIDKAAGVLKGLGEKEKVWMSHGDTVYALPSDYEVLAHSENSPMAAFRHREKPIYCLQWHPEVAHTEKGAKMLKNFIFEVCCCKPNWQMEDFITRAVQEIRQTVNPKRREVTT